MRITAVIGANFGDEGKGLLTDYFAAKDASRTAVVRANGGAQAAHTVVTPEGTRHVFHHFGSGTFIGAATILGEAFIVNPLLWDIERREIGSHPTVYAHADARVTTPYDMAVNQEIERQRSNRRHGSCGVGIFETTVRSVDPDFHLAVRHLRDRAALRQRLDRIRREYVPARLERLGISSPSAVLAERLSSDVLLDNYLDVCRWFCDAVQVVPDHGCLRRYENVVFEGAQGLLLDECNRRFAPHLTPSRTGLYEPCRIMEELGLGGMRAVYVTRAYMTRHGAGPFPTEDAGLFYPDPTNVHNEFQGSLRFGILDLDLMAESVRADVDENRQGVDVEVRVAVTCLDQVGVKVRWKSNGEQESHPLALVHDVARRFYGCAVYGSNGPTRDRVRVAVAATPVEV